MRWMRWNRLGRNYDTSLLQDTSSVTFGDSLTSQFGIVARRRSRLPCSVPHWAFSCLHPPQAAAGYGPRRGSLLVGFSHTISFTTQENASLVQREVPRRGGGIAVPRAGYKCKLMKNESIPQGLRPSSLCTREPFRLAFPAQSALPDL